MAAIPKLSPERWSEVRAAWEADPREGFTWLREQLSLPVSRESVRKKAIAESWSKHLGSTARPTSTGNAAKVPPKVAEAIPGNHPAIIDDQSAEEVRPFKTRETAILDELDQTEPRQGIFVREYCRDLNGTQAAIRAGYSIDGAHAQASRMLKDVKVQAAIRELRDETLRNLEAKVEELVAHWLDVLRADPNQITSFRRQCCPYCHGQLKEDGYQRYRQYTPARFHEAKDAHETKRARKSADEGRDIGDFDSVEGDWYSRHRPPNPQCPECEGEGIGEHFVADTRNLPPGVAALFKGVKQTKDGIEVLMSSKEKAADQLGRFLGAFKEREVNVNVTAMNLDSLNAIFENNLAAARERQAKVDRERGNIIDVTPKTAVGQ